MIHRLAPVLSGDTDWLRTSRRRVFYDAHTPDWTDPHQRGNRVDTGVRVLSDVRPESDLELMASAGVDSVVLFAKCQYGNAYYPTRIGRQHAALAGRDLLGEQLAAAHARGIRVIAYFSNMWDVAAAGRHPEWRLVPLLDAATGRWPALCLRSGYRDFALAQVREIAERYPIDGLWSDILTAGPCSCPRCSRAFEAETGLRLPQSRQDRSWLELVRFSQRTVGSYLDDQRSVLRAARSATALIPNFYATTFVDAVTGLTNRHLDVADAGSSEGYTDWHGLGFPSFASEYVGSAVLGRPREVLVSRFVHTWDFTLRSVAQLRFEAFTVAAHGAAVSVDDQPSGTGAISNDVYARLGPVFERIAERQPWLVDTEPEPWAAIWSSQSARDLDSLLGGPEAPTQGEQSARFPRSEPHPAESDLVAAITGSYRALVESHLPVTLVDERPEWLGRLDRFAVLVLADVLALSEAEAEAIRSFVERGGGLVVTGAVGTRTADGAERTRGALDGLLGLTFGTPSPFSFPYLTIVDKPLGLGLPTDPLPHYGHVRRLEPDGDDLHVLARRTDPVLETDLLTYWHNNQPAAGHRTDEPFIVERRYGAGRVIVSAARLGNNHARLGHEAYRELLARLVLRASAAPPPVTLEGGRRSTEIVLARQGDDLIVHAVTGAPVARLGLIGAPQPAAVEDVALLPALTFRVPSSTSTATRIVGGVALPLPILGGRVVVTDADDWETLVLRGAAR